MLLLDAWPSGKYAELATRLILNCSGSAFMKLQLHQTELMDNERKSIKRLIEILGGHWGQIGLEKKYEHAERALYKCIQKQDESADSFLARADIMWTELNSKNLKLSDLQGYVTLRGSTLSSDDKKKILIDADAAGTGDCQYSEWAVCNPHAWFKMSPVSSTWSRRPMIGPLCLPKLMMMRRLMRCMLLMVRRSPRMISWTLCFRKGTLMRSSSLILKMQHQSWSKDMPNLQQPSTRTLRPDDAWVKKSDSEVSVLCPQLANPRVSSRVATRVSFTKVIPHQESLWNNGSWPPNAGSVTRSAIGRAECPERSSRASQPSASAPTSFVSVDAALPLEFFQLPEITEKTIDDPQPNVSVVYVMGHQDFQGKLRDSLNVAKTRNLPVSPSQPTLPRSEFACDVKPEPMSDASALFATH